MAKERVQVQGIGGAVPGISPTIQRGGQYSVQVQQAGRNKLMDLADALGQVNPLLRQYAGVAEQEAEMFEEELARKSPEEVQAMLKKTESELDKQVRRGGLGWLMSPLNQKRKLRAVGQASSRLMMEQVYNRLDNPQEGDADLSTSDIISLVQQDFVGNNEALAGSTFAQEGLQEAVNPQILPLVRQYDAQKNRIAKGETAFGTTNVFYELAKDGNNLGEYDEETSKALLGSWENLNAFTAAEQRDILGKVFENLAKNGMEEKADSLLLWASNNVKIGASKMTEIEYDGYATMIERTAEVAGKLEEKNRADRVEDQAAKFRIAYNDIQRIGNGTYNGQEYTDLVSLQQAAEQAPEFDDDFRGKSDLQAQLEAIVRSDVDPVTMYVNEIFRNPFAQGAIRGGIEEIDNAFNSTLSLAEFDVALAQSDPSILRIKSEADAQFQQSLNQELKRIAQLPEGRDSMNASQLVNDFVIKEKERISRELERKVQIRLNKLEERSKLTNTRITENQVAPEKSVFDNTVDNFEKTTQANNVILNRAAPLEERKKAVRFFRDVDLNEIAGIVNGTKVKQEATSVYSYTTGAATVTPAQPYTEAEKQKALDHYIQAAALSVEFIKGDVLKKGITTQGVRFDPKKIDPARFRLLTEEELDAVKDITDINSKDPSFLKVKEIAKQIDADDAFEVITKQQKLFKSLADL
jgi:hypothetical protein